MAEKKNIRLTVAYDGKNYHGWQRQKSDLTIQGLLEDKIAMMAGEPVTLIASGRTDAGVHAENQVCHFITGSKIKPETFKQGLNSLLTEDILIKEASYVSLNFHARYSAKGKSYEYRILNRQEPDVFLRDYVWHIPWQLDLNEIAKCLTLIQGQHDFSAFKSSGSGNRDPVRNMIKAEFRGPENDVISLLFEADGFLRHMVRNIVGTLVEVGQGKRNFEEFRAILNSKDRKRAGIKAPPQGLFLKMVMY